MISYGLKVNNRLRIYRELTFEVYLRWFVETVLPIVQQRHFRSGEASGNRVLSTSTVQLRARRVDYYEAEPTDRVTAFGPFGVWTGATMLSSYGIGPGSRVSYGFGVAIVMTELRRWWVLTWWNLRELERWVTASLDKHFDRVLNGRVAA